MADFVRAGDVLGNVLLGCLLDDVVAVWTATGSRLFFRTAEPERLRSLIGKGVAARTSHEPERYREIALLNQDDHRLFVAGRLFQQGGEASAAAPADSFQVEPCEPPAPSEALWGAASRWFSGAVVSAVGRGEFVVLETGGWDAVREPYAFACASREADGGWLSYIEAAPLPTKASWQAAYRGPRPAPGATLTSAATEDAFVVSGIFLSEAVSMWAASPFDVVLSFGAAPSGPWNPNVTPQVS